MVEIIIKIVASVVVVTVAGFSIVYIFNRMPARWLCDYGEKLSLIHIYAGRREYREVGQKAPGSGI